jgi:urease accessory protein
MMLRGEGGTAFFLDFPRVVSLRHGDGLVLNDGSIVAVVGTPEALVEVRAGNPVALARLAWHIGNRHSTYRSQARRCGCAAITSSRRCSRGSARPSRSSTRRSIRSRAPMKASMAAMRLAMIMTDEVHSADSAAAFDAAGLYRLMGWMSPSFPTGGFSYSSGLEWAVEAGDIADAASLERWLGVVISEGGVFCDAVFFVHAYRAIANAAPDNVLCDLVELAAAFAPSKERHLETTAQGNAFVIAARAAWPCAALERLVALSPEPYAYPVAVGVTAAGHGIALRPALLAFLHGVMANLVSAGLRLIPLGQTDGQRVTSALEPAVHAAAARALSTPLDDIGGAAFRADIASMRHETQYTRLFRS